MLNRVGKGTTGLLHFTLIPYLIMLSVKQGGIKCQFFLVFGMTQPGIEGRSPGSLVNTLLFRPMTRCIWSCPNYSYETTWKQFVDKILKRAWALFHIDQWFPVLLYNIHNLSFVRSHLYIFMYKLLVLDKNTWTNIIVSKFLVLNRNTSEHVSVY